MREAQEAKSKGRLMNAATGWDLDLAELERMLDEYYALRGWSKNGIPTPERLHALGLDFAIPA